MGMGIFASVLVVVVILLLAVLTVEHRRFERARSETQRLTADAQSERQMGDLRAEHLGRVEVVLYQGRTPCGRINVGDLLQKVPYPVKGWDGLDCVETNIFVMPDAGYSVAARLNKPLEAPGNG